MTFTCLLRAVINWPLKDLLRNIDTLLGLLGFLCQDFAALSL